MEDEYFAAFGDDFLDSDFLSVPESVPAFPHSTVPPGASRQTPPRPPPEQAFRRADKLREELVDSEIEGKITSILAYMNNLGLNLEIFLDYVFWGHTTCIKNREVVYERTGFLNSPTFERVMGHLWKPPTRASSHETAMHAFVLDAAGQILERELKHIAKLLTSPKDGLSKENLTGLNLRDLGEILRTSEACELWGLLERLARTHRQTKENTVKDPFLVILTIIVMISYSRSHDVSRVPEVWSLYLKSCGLSARAFDTLHALGLTMSHKWAADAYGQISQNAQAATRLAITEFPHFGSHDNLNIPLRVFSQRLFNKNHFINVSAATIWVLPKEAFDFLPQNLRDLVQERRRSSAKTPLTLTDIYVPPVDVTLRRRAQDKYRILRFLLESSAFTEYEHRNNPLLAPPPPTYLLPCGAACVVDEHILETVEVDESSYEGTDQLCGKIWPSQMGYGRTEDERKQTGLERLIVWVGDQLTVDRMRGLMRYLFDEPNSFDRMDFYEPHFGWFHALMAVANSLHAQYLGTTAGVGLRKAFEVLGRKGLMKTETKGTFWHDLDEALWHIGEGHFHALWCEVSGVEELAELKTKSPEELLELLDKIYKEHSCREALVQMEGKPVTEHDEIKEQMVMFGADILPYFDLREAIRIGDVGRMEDLLPTLLFRFVGGGNHKYAVEILELIHKLKTEWPDPLRNYIRRYCWLLNRSGKRDGFFPVDLGQEHNIRDIKVTWRSFGPGATFSYIQKISPAIPTLRALRDAITAQFPALLGRGARHGTPSKENDVMRIHTMYRDSKLHKQISGRTFSDSPKERAKDFISMGAERLSADGIVERWWGDRYFERSVQEIYSIAEYEAMDIDSD